MTTRPDRPHWPEIDALRGIAAALMVFNHVAVQRPPRPSGGPVDPIEVAAFIGSFAPVMFFFVTGLGHGVQSAGRAPGRGRGYLLKAAILILADWLLWVGPGDRIGLDFLGFIGLSMVLLRWTEHLPRSGRAAAALGAGFVVLRFGIGPAARPWLPPEAQGNWAGLLLGIGGFGHFSYPPAPWMAFPFFGYALGRAAAGARPWLEANRARAASLLAAMAALLAGATLALAAGGASLFRWGNMSLGYFVASLSAIALYLAIVVAAYRARPTAGLLGAIALGGVRSFAVVPLHYLLVAAMVAAAGPVVGPAYYLTAAAAVLALSFAGSALVPMASALLKPSLPGRLGPVRAILAAGALAAYFALAAGAIGGDAAVVVRHTSILGLCLLLTLL